MYTLLFLGRGDLPWSLFKVRRPEDILDLKVYTDAEDMFYGLHPCYLKLYKYVIGLEEYEFPDYSLMK